MTPGMTRFLGTLIPMIFHTQDGVTDKNWRNSSMTSAESSIWKSGVSSRTKARSTENFPFSPVACLDIRVRDTSCWWLVQVSTLRTVYSAWQYESMIWVNFTERLNGKLSATLAVTQEGNNRRLLCSRVSKIICTNQAHCGGRNWLSPLLLQLVQIPLELATLNAEDQRMSSYERLVEAEVPAGLGLGLCCNTNGLEDDDGNADDLEGWQHRWSWRRWCLFQLALVTQTPKHSVQLLVVTVRPVRILDVFDVFVFQDIQFPRHSQIRLKYPRFPTEHLATQEPCPRGSSRDRPTSSIDLELAAIFFRTKTFLGLWYSITVIALSQESQEVHDESTLYAVQLYLHAVDRRFSYELQSTLGCDESQVTSNDVEDAVVQEVYATAECAYDETQITPISRRNNHWYSNPIANTRWFSILGSTVVNSHYLSPIQSFRYWQGDLMWSMY